MRYEFLIETYETERVKVVSTWSEFRDDEMRRRPRDGDPRGRNIHEHMVHQCVSEDLWFRNMLGIDVSAPPLPAVETRLEFMKRYAEDSTKRLAVLRAKDEAWWEGETQIFRRTALSRLGHDAAHRAHGAPSWPANRHAADAGPRPAQ